MNEVQVIATVMSASKDNDPDIAALIGTSAALAISGIPFSGPIGAARVGFIDDMYVLNPTYTALKNSALDLVVAGTENAVLMVESEAKELTEDQMKYAASDVLYLHELRAKLDEMLAREGRTEIAGACFDFLPHRAVLDVGGWADQDIFSHSV
jgi:polyribonucleotide nucleotidyltransferase